MKRSILTAGILLVFCFLVSGCGAQKTATRTDFALDTVITITLYGTDNEDLLTEPFEKIREMDRKFSAYDEESEISAINKNAGIAPVTVSADTLALINTAMQYNTETEGLFDIAIGPLTDLWGINTPGEGTVPEESAIQTTLQLLDSKNVVIDEAQSTVYLTQPKMKLNLGAIAKGFIGDVIKTELETADVAHGVINLGGNVVLIGGKTDHESFNVGIENPEDTEKQPLGVIALKDKTAVTSGDYQRYFTDAQGKRWHHILNPKTGYPADSGLHQVTVVTDVSAKADALSTSFFLMGMEEALTYCKTHQGIDAIFVTTDNRIVITEGLSENFTFDEATYGETYRFLIAE